MKRGKLTIKQRMLLTRGFFLLIGLALVARLVWIQFVKGSEYKAAAEAQQTREQKIASKRGTIYDRNMNVLATSGSAERIYINPRLINKTETEAKENEEKSKAEAVKNGGKYTEYENTNLTEKVVNVLIENLDVDEEWLRTQLAKTDRASIEVKANVEKEKADKIREANLVGIEFSEDSKRYYPNGNLACHLLGFTGKDGQGLEGLENILDDELSGTAGRLLSAKSASNGEMPFKYETYEAATDGNNVVLTIDKTIQQILENHLQTAYEENKLGNGAAGIIMNPKTGEIYAMAGCPSYDLSDYNTITDESLLEQVDTLMEEQNELYEEAQARIAADEAEKGDEDIKPMTYDEAYAQMRNKMHRNKAVVDSYEPGSTFKTIVASAALEEDVVSLDDTFVCTGAKVVSGTTIHCWKTEGHGTETFVEGIKNSCNPVFMDVGAKLGSKSFYKYFQAFGLTEKTGFLIPGESEGIHYSESELGPVQLATCSFGQSLTVTPLQMVRAVSAVVNGGYLMEPHIVKSYTDSEGNVIENVDPVVVRRVISQETSDTMREVLEKVVSEGGGSGAYVKGYRIGGKTGTSEKLPRGSGLTIASFVGFAPVDDPEIVCLIILDEPTNGLTMGGQIAAPVAGGVIEETLKYLGYEPQYTDEESEQASILTPELAELSVDEAKTKVSDIGLKASVKGSGDTVIRQIPQSGTKLHSGSMVILYTEETEEDEAAIEVPSVHAKTYSQAKVILEDAGLEIAVDGGADDEEPDSSFLAISQSPAAKSRVAKGTKVYVTFADEDTE